MHLKTKREGGKNREKGKKQETLIETGFQYSPALLIASAQGFGIDPAEGRLLSAFLTDGAGGSPFLPSSLCFDNPVWKLWQMYAESADPQLPFSS